MTAPSSETSAARTPFHAFHVEHGARMVLFAGWEMPLLYRSIRDEHRQVRESGGLFDVSHMGRLRFSGRDARRFLDHVCTRLVHGMADGQIRYSLVCNERGGCKDDVLIYCMNADEYLMVCNAANRTKLLEHFALVKERSGLVFKLRDETERTAMIAIQGPRVMETIAAFSSQIPALKRYRFLEKGLLGARVLISRTGYTGEDGVEVILPAALARPAVGMLLKNIDVESDPAVIRPAGLGARDTLRMEAAMALYGHEIDEELDPVSAGLHFAVKLDKGDDDAEVGTFIGQDALRRIAEQGPRQVLAGLLLTGRRSARQGMKVMAGDADIGFVTSGCLSPTLDRPIAMAYVRTAEHAVGRVVQVGLGRTTCDAEIVTLPFYKSG